MLLQAAEKGHDEIVEMLIDPNERVTAEDENGLQPLHYAGYIQKNLRCNSHQNKKTN